jgi:hypothetical protein
LVTGGRQPAFVPASSRCLLYWSAKEGKYSPRLIKQSFSKSDVTNDSADVFIPRSEVQYLTSASEGGEDEVGLGRGGIGFARALLVVFGCMGKPALVKAGCGCLAVDSLAVDSLAADG